MGHERHMGFVCVSHSEYGFCEDKFRIMAQCQICDAFYRIFRANAQIQRRGGEFGVFMQTCFLLPPCSKCQGRPKRVQETNTICR